jgi:hypothetical protein
MNQEKRSNLPPHETVKVEELAGALQIPPAFIRLAIECGCPAPDGQLSHFALTEWLLLHYNQVRKVAGLPEVAESDAPPGDRHHATIALGNMLRTLVDYGASRHSRPEMKSACREWSRLLENEMLHRGAKAR